MRRAFSLIELMVAAAIIAILTSLALSGLRAARLRSEDARCASNLRSVGQLITSYVGQHNGAPAPVVRDRDYRWSDGVDLGWDIQTGRWAGVPGGAGTIWHCTQSGTSRTGNAHALGMDTSQALRNGPRYLVNTSRWAEPGRLVLVYDMQRNLLELPGLTHIADPDVADVSNERRTSWPMRRAPLMGANLVDFGPHRGAFGVLFADGHAAVDQFPRASRALFWSGPRWWNVPPNATPYVPPGWNLAQ